MNGYYFDASCPRCGAEFQHVTGSRPMRTETRAVAYCTSCKRHWLVAVYVCEVTVPTDGAKRQAEYRQRRAVMA